MFKKNRIEKELLKNLEQLNFVLSRNRVLELAELLGNKKQLILRNLITGITKGIGIGIGVTILTAFLLIILQKIVTLNIPVIGDYIADIIEIVQNKLWFLNWFIVSFSFKSIIPLVCLSSNVKLEQLEDGNFSIK